VDPTSSGNIFNPKCIHESQNPNTQSADEDDLSSGLRYNMLAYESLRKTQINFVHCIKNGYLFTTL
jgi:hypothetical protein